MYHYSRIFIRPLLIMVLLASPAAVSLAVFEDRTAPCDFYPTTPAAPDSLTAEVEGNQVTLTWKDNSGDEEGFIIERSTDDFTSSVSIADVDADITTTVDSDLSDGAYSYRVYAYNDFGNSEYSDVATATVVSVAEPTPTPSPSESPVAVISDNILVKETIIASPCAKITVVKEAQNGFGNFTFTLSK